MNNNSKTIVNKPTGWITWSYFLFAFISFLYIGNKGQKRQWTYIGLGYAVLFTILMIGSELKESNPQLYDIISSCGAAYWIGSVIHCHMVKKEYWMRLAVLESEEFQQANKERILQEIRREHGLADIPKRQPADEVRQKLKQQAQAHQQKGEPQQQQQKPAAPPASPIDINSCSVEELAQLPGVSMVMAKKADAVRRSGGGFHSVDEFFQVVQLKPHFVVQVQEMVRCEVPQQSTPAPSTQQPNSGRRLDL